MHSGLDAQHSSRREFLGRCSAAAASGLLLGSAAAAAEERPTPLPTIALGKYRITRLVVGSNPISGYSYLGKETDQAMRAYFTPERTLEFLKQCERAGINTHQFSMASKAEAVYRKLREEGSKLQLIGLLQKREDVKKIAEMLDPIALVHHGGVTDRLFKEGQSGQVRDFVKAVRDQGLLAGVSAHNPDCIKQIADQGWEVDLLMTCFHNLSREKPLEDQPVLEPSAEGKTFYQNDPLAMCAVIRQMKQPCLAFKILGAGRKCATQEVVRAAFRFAFQQIKRGDAVIAGMYPRQFDQVRANAEYTRELG